MIYPFSHYLYKCENETVEELLDRLVWDEHKAAEICNDATDLVEKIRQKKGRGGQLEAFLQEFSLNTDEGLALMCLAEALLRIPDAYTANMLIRDKVVAVDWLQQQGASKDWIAKVAGMGMAITRKTLDSALSKLGEPLIREAMARAMQMMGKHFVLGSDIKDAIFNAGVWKQKGYRMSYDILGEAARDRETAREYFNAYSLAIDEIGQSDGGINAKADDKSGVSVKLSALHPRYEYAQRGQAIPEIVEMLTALCIKAAHYDIPLTVDAEEVDRLDLSVQIFEEVLAHDALAGWHGFGLAVQAYQKRSVPLIEYIIQMARKYTRQVQIRLVKGAYWDSEIKYAQIGGVEGYPVFTRKSNTDLSYLTCAQILLDNTDVIYPMFATHNAHTIIAIHHMAEGRPYEFQRLHGMGEAVYAHIMDENPNTRVSIYAPVGPHKDLLPYLVRRLLENGANSSFVNQLLDHNVSAKSIVRDPVSLVRIRKEHSHPVIQLPRNIFGQNRLNSKGLNLNNALSAQGVEEFVAAYNSDMVSFSIIDGQRLSSIDETCINSVFHSLRTGFVEWQDEGVQRRIDILNRFADLLEENYEQLMAILVWEGGKTIPDARDEVREAIDFARYYAIQASQGFPDEGVMMSGYTGEENKLFLQGRGVFVCISPWNFPLAIFAGQICAALVAGNTVIAKPASQTRYIAMRCTQLLFKAGVPHNVLSLLLGNGQFASEVLKHRNVAGVAFTGSTVTAKHIQKILVEHNDAIVPFIAETGGQNAMIVDSSALPEQVVDDVLLSAFGSAGQRCSALRVLYVQEEIADRVISLLQGAMAELIVDHPSSLLADIGYIIDLNAKKSLDKHVEYISKVGDLIARTPLNTRHERLFAPCAYEISDIELLKGEVFGPVLHVIRYRADMLRNVISQINSTGYGLTCGIHSRISTQYKKLAHKVNVGNVYINRSMTGAVVGVQPFGGMGASGTGPKAGGPHYLHAFAVEKLVSTNITASGGNASLISLDDE